jgi:hypothetical protein
MSIGSLTAAAEDGLYIRQALATIAIAIVAYILMQRRRELHVRFDRSSSA